MLLCLNLINFCSHTFAGRRKQEILCIRFSAILTQCQQPAIQITLAAFELSGAINAQILTAASRLHALLHLYSLSVHA